MSQTDQLPITPVSNGSIVSPTTPNDFLPSMKSMTQLTSENTFSSLIKPPFDDIHSLEDCHNVHIVYIAMQIIDRDDEKSSPLEPLIAHKSILQQRLTDPDLEIDGKYIIEKGKDEFAQTLAGSFVANGTTSETARDAIRVLYDRISNYNIDDMANDSNDVAIDIAQARLRNTLSHSAASQIKSSLQHRSSGSIVARQQSLKSLNTQYTECSQWSDEIKDHLDDTPYITDKDESFDSLMAKMSDNEVRAAVKPEFDVIWNHRERQRELGVLEPNKLMSPDSITKSRSAVNLEIGGIMDIEKGLSLDGAVGANMNHMPLPKGAGNWTKQISRDLSKKLEPLTKGQRTLWQEQCLNERCGDYRECPCFQRTEAVLGVYHRFNKKISRWKRKNRSKSNLPDIDSMELSVSTTIDEDDVSFSEHMEMDNDYKIDSLFQTAKYDVRCLQEDFLHILDAHIHQMDEITLNLRQKFKCTKGCQGAVRIRRDGKDKSSTPTVRGLMEQIHSYFIQLRLC